MSESGIDGFFKRLGAGARRFCAHALFLLASSVVCTAFYPGGADYMEWIWWYLALVLLIPVAHEGYRRPMFAVPAAFGLIEAAIGAFMGLSAGAALFTGGILAWMLRRVFYRRRYAWEWSAILGIAFGFLVTKGALPGQLASTHAWAPFIPVLAAGCTALWTALKLDGRRLRRENLQRLASAMSAFEEDPRIPREVRQILPSFNEALKGYVSSSGDQDTGKAPLDALPKLYFALDTVATGITGPRGAFKNDLELKIAAGQAQAQLAKAAACLRQETERLSGGTAGQGQGSAPYAELDGLASALVRASEGLDDVAKESALSIARSASSMITALRQGADDGDAPSFLKRYLKAASSIVGDYKHLIARAERTDADFAAVQRARAVLSRMAKAFSDELSAMQDSGREKFEASLKAFDEFMRMNGR